jgi:phage tail-like protein
LSSGEHRDVIRPRTSFRVLIGTSELACSAVHGLASETVSTPTGTTIGERAVPPPGADDAGPTIGANPRGHPPNAQSPVLEWTLTPVSICRALDDSRELFVWRAAIVAGQPDTREVTIQLLDSPRGQPVLTWKLQEAWPLSWSGPTLDALAPGIALEQVELAYARLQWLKNPETGGV